MEVWTARISTKDPDRLDISRKSGEKAFAPSWAILGPALQRRRAGIPQTEEEWKDYAALYLREMSISKRQNPDTWAALLARPRVVLVCYCSGDPKRCHRHILALILAHLGATYRGELLSAKGTVLKNSASLEEDSDDRSKGSESPK
jgi:uncharacterized protein YeaO (DUF488 family)